MKKLYRYHIRIYEIYEKYGTGIFCVSAAREALKALESGSLTIPSLVDREYLERATKEDLTIFDKVDRRMKYFKISPRGIEVVNFVKRNPKLLTKFLLEN
jgi:hypothetical protein